MSWASCLYEGHVRHRRTQTVKHEFSYCLFMLYVDLAELPELFRDRWLWSTQCPNIAWFRRADHFGPPEQPLAESVRALVHERTGGVSTGPIRLLTHFRYFGYIINPISLFYCFDPAENLEFVVAEVTNTPWGERHCYVLDVRGQTAASVEAFATKMMHVSPYFSMDFEYHFQLRTPGETLTLHIKNLPSDNNVPATQSAHVFDATLTLRRKTLTSINLAWMLVRYPVMTAQVFIAIYWQALRLWWKRVPVVSHPNSMLRTTQEQVVP